MIINLFYYCPIVEVFWPTVQGFKFIFQKENLFLYLKRKQVIYIINNILEKLIYV